MDNNRSLRILHVQHSLAPGGMENGVVNVANMLTGNGFEFHVACLSHRGSFADRMPDGGNVIAFSKPEGFSPRTVSKLARHIRSLRPDVVHSHNLGALIYSALATRWGRFRPILHGEHGTPDDGKLSRKRNAQRKIFYTAAKIIHTVSVSLRDHLISLRFPSKKIVPLVNGVDTTRFTPGDREIAKKSLGIRPEDPVIVIVGRLIASKQHELLFKAFEEVVSRWGRAVLLVIGAGGSHEGAVLEAARNSPVFSNIRMEGFCSDPLPHYRASDILVAPSSVEGLSNVVLEAMASGTAPVVHDACGNTEVIEHLETGIIGNLSTKEELARQLIETLSDLEACRLMGLRARESVSKRFSLNSMAEGYANVYRDLSG